MSAIIFPFSLQSSPRIHRVVDQDPAPYRRSRNDGPVVTIARYTTMPRGSAYVTSFLVPDGVPGWACEVRWPGGVIVVKGFHRDRATALQEAARIAVAEGWRLELHAHRAKAAGGQP